MVKKSVAMGKEALFFGMVCAMALISPIHAAPAKDAPEVKKTLAKTGKEIVRERKESYMHIVSWNAASRQFIDPPSFKLLPNPSAAWYSGTVNQRDTTRTVKSQTPILDLAPIWKSLSEGTFELKFEWTDKEGRVIDSHTSTRVKAPDWRGMKDAPVDWAESADKNIAFLIDAAENAPAFYREPGVPVWVWKAKATRADRQPRPGTPAYPSLHMPLMIGAFVACAEMDRPQAKEARAMAEVCGQWLLTHRQPDTGVLPLFPHSTISDGKFIGSGADGNSVNLLRASHMALGLVTLYELTANEALLDYACHIADTTMKFQNPDGSFPYRINSATGEVTERYTCHASEFIALVEALSRHRYDPQRKRAALRAVDWMLAYPFQTRHWQSAFEDIGELLPYQNLENWSANYLIRYLCRNKDEDPRYAPAAEKLNRWVEDQFVAFGRDESITVNCHTPLVMEQFVVYFPMEVHTANWILALLELHKATGKKEYLDKAMAAGNAIAKSQFPNGELSTWGVDIVTGKSGTTVANWYGCNAWATEALYRLSDYVNRLKKRS